MGHIQGYTNGTAHRFKGTTNHHQPSTARQAPSHPPTFLQMRRERSEPLPGKAHVCCCSGMSPCAAASQPGAAAGHAVSHLLGMFNNAKQNLLWKEYTSMVYMSVTLPATATCHSACHAYAAGSCLSPTQSLLPCHAMPCHNVSAPGVRHSSSSSLINSRRKPTAPYAPINHRKSEKEEKGEEGNNMKDI